MKLKLKELISKILLESERPAIIAVQFSQTITSKTTGGKTASATIDVPAGYEVIPNCRPLSPYISGEATVTITDRGVVTMNGSTASFSYYLYNPQNKNVNLIIAANILCRKVGGGYCVTQLLQGLRRLSRHFCLEVV